MPDDPAPHGAPGASRELPHLRPTDGFRSSGQSPGREPARLHLVGPGQVGRAFLRRAAELPVRVVALSDRTATVYDPSGLDLAALLAHKSAGRPLAEWPRAERLPTELAIAVVQASVVVDATPSATADAEAAVRRADAALQAGAFVALCGKNALAAAAPRWLLGPQRAQLGIQAVLGGTGRQLLRELDELRAGCSELLLVGNVTTTVLIQAVERGAGLAEGIAAAQAQGLLEPDPSLDLDGSDAATKLAAVHGAVFGAPGFAPVPVAAVARQAFAALDPALLRARVQRGATTRLVARARRGGGLAVEYVELPLGHPLVAPPDRVVYGYQLPGGLRVHTGLGVGYERTASGLLDDVRAALEVRS